VSGHLHTPAASLPGRETPIHIKQKAGLEDLEWRKVSCPRPGFETRLLSYPVRSLVTISPELSRLNLQMSCHIILFLTYCVLTTD
jgi:hypothetical protein